MEPAIANADDARRIASELAASKGWPFTEPVHARRQRTAPFFGAWRWTVVSNADSRGANVRVEIDERRGLVVSSAFNPR